MAFDDRKNLAIGFVATAPSPATSGTSLVLVAGQGARFAVPPFNATVGPPNTILTPANSEIVRVTAISTDTLTITRTQEGSSARSIAVGDVVYAGPTDKTFDDIETVVNASSGTLNTAFPLGVGAWTAYNPSLTQSGAVTKTNTYAAYTRIGNTIHAHGFLSVTGTGTAGVRVVVGLPVAAMSAATGVLIGAGGVGDSSAGQFFPAAPMLITTTTFSFMYTSGAGELGAQQFTAALASGDSVRFAVTYEAA